MTLLLWFSIKSTCNTKQCLMLSLATLQFQAVGTEYTEYLRCIRALQLLWVFASLLQIVRKLCSLVLLSLHYRYVNLLYLLRLLG